MLSTFFAISLLLAPTSSPNQPTGIPENYHGIWKITEVMDEDGTRTTSDEEKFSDCSPVELIVTGNRIISVRDDGSSVVAKVKVLKNRKQLTLCLRTGIYHDKEQVPTYWNVRLDGDKLSIELAIDQYKSDPRNDRTAVPSFQAHRETK